MLRVQGKELDLRVSTVPTAHGESGGDAPARPRDRGVRFPQARLHRPLPAAVPEGAGAAARHPAGHRPDRFGQDHHAVHRAVASSTPPTSRSSPSRIRSNTRSRASTRSRPSRRSASTSPTRCAASCARIPDIIMIGEMRDLETARIAIQSALTGHLVLSHAAHQQRRRRHHPHARHGRRGLPAHLDHQRHPRPAPGAPAGADACRAIPGLARGNREVRPAPLPAARATIFLYRPRASAIAPTGYLGRTTIMEFLVMNDELRRAVMRHAGMGELEQLARAGRHAHDVRGRHRQGAGAAMTTIEEVLRVTEDA